MASVVMGGEETEGKIAVVRRRRTSSSTNLQALGQHKARRTSLPVIGVQRNSLSHGNQGGVSSVDAALLSEAHGLITDMLADTSLPSHAMTGLRALSTLICPPNHSLTHQQQRPRISGMVSITSDLSLAGSDSEDLPIMGEKLSTLPKKFRRNFPMSLLRRMSTSTWTTTTSATGMPTLEPEPCRKRSTSFRHMQGNRGASPCSRAMMNLGYGQSQHADDTPCMCCTARNHAPTEHDDLELLPNSLSPTSTGRYSPSDISLEEGLPVTKHRSYSTTSLHQQLTPSPLRCLARERKTVCSLHPLTASDINRLNNLSDQALAASRQQAECGEGRASSAGTSPTPSPTPTPTPTEELLRASSNSMTASSPVDSRVTSTSVEASSKSPRRGSPVSPAAVARVVVDVEYSRTPTPSPLPPSSPLISPVHVPVQKDLDGDFGDSAPVSSSEVTPLADIVSPEHLGDGIEDKIVYLEDGCRFDLQLLATDVLLNRVHDWDYPIFELHTVSPDSILSQMCYRVFLEVGLFETFRIPVQEFLAYFHALECGYRDKPYHNRLHAADVLHAVYYLTSQPIPGFNQLSQDVESPPHSKIDMNSNCSPGLMQRQSFNVEDTYGILGANLPALELMALYTATAMHDYDHPGRTNAFLVTTYAPQAVLYNDRSVLENHHAAAAWTLFLSRPDYDFLCHLEKAEFKRFRFLVIEAILATDLKRHFEILAEFNAKVNDDDAPGIDWNSEQDRLLVMQMCIKLADINGPCKRHDIHVQWTARIADEFYEQGDEEASLGLPISPFMDRKNPQLAKLQESFINHLVAPLCTSYGEAGLLPGQWLEDSESDEENGYGCDDKVETSDCKDTEDDNSNDNDSRSDKMSTGKSSSSLKKMTCLPTQHLKENYDYWMAIIKEEQRVKEMMEILAEGNCVQLNLSSSEQLNLVEDEIEMETIHEEEPQSGRTTTTPTCIEEENSKL